MYLEDKLLPRLGRRAVKQPKLTKHVYLPLGTELGTADKESLGIR